MCVCVCRMVRDTHVEQVTIQSVLTIKNTFKCSIKQACSAEERKKDMPLQASVYKVPGPRDSSSDLPYMSSTDASPKPTPLPVCANV